MNLMTKRLLTSLPGVLALIATSAVFCHGNVTPQAVDTEGLEPLGEEWRETNPYLGNENAIEIGKSAYNQNCARCHGLGAVSGGIAPDLRELPSGPEGDEFYVPRVRNGAIRNGVTYMPAFEGLVSQEGLWAIRAWLETVSLDAQKKPEKTSDAKTAPEKIESIAADESLALVKERGVLEVAVYKEFPPYSYKQNGKQAGVDIDIANELASRMSLKVNIRMVGADENVEDDLRNNVWKGHYLGGGTADVMLHMPVDQKFSDANDQVKFISPYQLETIIFACDKARLGERPTLANFTHEPVGVELDTLSDFYLLRAIGGKIASNVRHFKSIAEAITSLKKGEIAAVMGPRGEIEGALGDQDKNINVQRLITPGLGVSSWAMGMAVKADYTELAKTLNETMMSMVSDGTIEEIFKRHGVTYSAPAVVASS